jgi:hypothetical protein
LAVSEGFEPPLKLLRRKPDYPIADETICKKLIAQLPGEHLSHSQRVYSIAIKLAGDQGFEPRTLPVQSRAPSPRRPFPQKLVRFVLHVEPKTRDLKTSTPYTFLLRGIVSAGFLNTGYLWAFT